MTVPGATVLSGRRTTSKRRPASVNRCRASSSARPTTGGTTVAVPGAAVGGSVVGRVVVGGRVAGVVVPGAVVPGRVVAGAADPAAGVVTCAGAVLAVG